MCTEQEDETLKLLKTYIGTSFAIFISLFPTKLTESQKLINELQIRRKEDSKANARVVEIFANHRHAWQEQEKRLLKEIEAIDEIKRENEELRRENEELVRENEDLRREVDEREEMLGFLAERERDFGDSRVCERGEMLGFERRENEEGECLERENVEEISGLFAANKLWGVERPNSWQQDVQYEGVEPLYDLKQFVSRREYPWKIDGETAGVFSKLKSLEQDLVNLEMMGKSELSKIPSQMRKQAKRYQALAGKIDDLCRRMQASDPSEANLSSEFRTQCQTEFLLEAFRLKHRSNETAQKLIALQTETGKSYFRNEVESQAKLTFKRCLDSVKNNLKEIQRNLEIWLARIIGDLEGVLARDGRVRDCYMSGYPLAQ